MRTSYIFFVAAITLTGCNFTIRDVTPSPDMESENGTGEAEKSTVDVFDLIGQDKAVEVRVDGNILRQPSGAVISSNGFQKGPRPLTVRYLGRSIPVIGNDDIVGEELLANVGKRVRIRGMTSAELMSGQGASNVPVQGWGGPVPDVVVHFIIVTSCELVETSQQKSDHHTREAEQSEGDLLNLIRQQRTVEVLVEGNCLRQPSGDVIGDRNRKRPRPLTVRYLDRSIPVIGHDDIVGKRLLANSGKRVRIRGGTMAAPIGGRGASELPSQSWARPVPEVVVQFILVTSCEPVESTDD